MIEAGSSSSQDRILYQIKRLGPQTARELGELLEVTTMGARQHLAQLEGDGLVSAMPQETRGRGRPVRRWKLTEQGHGRFPDAHAQVTSDLIISVRDLLGEDALQTIVAERTRQTLAQYLDAMADTHELEERVNKLCELRSAEGYMAEVVALEDGDFQLIEHHCPICIAAKSCQGFCQGELEVFERVFEGMATVTREDHLLAGARRCAYRISVS